ncbi:MAG: phage holin family protein [Defluviitaleaceae bacterium]|nr:phage holin family protein [Defluviitaleaceae bacterium]
MLSAIIISGIICTVLLLLISWLISFFNIGFLTLGVDTGFVPLVILALVLGVVNALLSPLVMGLFKKANGTALFIISLIVNAVLLVLVAHFVTALNINFVTALVVAAILSLVAPTVTSAGKN